MPIGEFCAVRGGDVFDSSKDMIEQLEELFKGHIHNIHMYCLSGIYTQHMWTHRNGEGNNLACLVSGGV